MDKPPFDFDLNARRHRVSREIVITEIKRYAANSSPPYSAAGFKKSHPAVSGDTVVRMFGTFKAAFEAAHVTNVSYKDNFSDEDLLSHFERLCALRSERGLSSVVPAISDFRNFRLENGSGPSHDAFTRRFGDYREFTRRYQDYHRGKITRALLIEKSKATLKPQRGPISKGMRAEVLHRCANRCTSCGRHATELGEKQCLEIDHIKPVVSGGLSTLDNLTAKCSDCNRGKGPRFVG